MMKLALYMQRQSNIIPKSLSQNQLGENKGTGVELYMIKAKRKKISSVKGNTNEGCFLQQWEIESRSRNRYV